jgi:fatty-acyl-CoA synthase
LTHHNILNNGYSVGGRLKLTDDDNICIPVPMYHCFGLVLGSLAAITHGSKITYPSYVFDPEAVMKAVDSQKCTALHVVRTAQ